VTGTTTCIDTLMNSHSQQQWSAGAFSEPVPQQLIGGLDVSVHAPSTAPGCRSWIRTVQGPLAHYAVALLAVEFNTAARVEVTSLPHEYMTLTQWLGNTTNRFECSGERGMHSSLSSIRTRMHAMSRPGGFVMLRAFLTPVGAIRLAHGHALADINRRAPAPWAETVGKLEALDLENTVLDAPSIAQKLDAFAGWIEQRVQTRREPVRAAVRAAQAATVLGREPWFDLDALARRASITRRQLERDFSQWLAVSPRRFAQAVRLQRLALASGQRSLSLAWLATETGFADQAHMSRAVRQLTGMTPRQFLHAADGAISQIYRKALGGRIGYVVHVVPQDQAE
jgi:AraC-like DNA-binding protein